MFIRFQVTDILCFICKYWLSDLSLNCRKQAHNKKEAILEQEKNEHKRCQQIVIHTKKQKNMHRKQLANIQLLFCAINLDLEKCFFSVVLQQGFLTKWQNKDWNNQEFVLFEL